MPCLHSAEKRCLTRAPVDGDSGSPIAGAHSRLMRPHRRAWLYLGRGRLALLDALQEGGRRNFNRPSSTAARASTCRGGHSSADAPQLSQMLDLDSDRSPSPESSHKALCKILETLRHPASVPRARRGAQYPRYSARRREPTTTRGSRPRATASSFQRNRRHSALRSPRRSR